MIMGEVAIVVLAIAIGVFMLTIFRVYVLAMVVVVLQLR